MHSANRLRRVAIVLSALAVLACDESGITDLGPEDRGSLLLQNVSGGFGPQDLLWARDESEVIFVDDQGKLRAVNISSHSVRGLGETNSILRIARGASGDRIHFVASIPDAAAGSPNLRIGRVDPASGAAETIALANLGANSSLAVSPDERWIAINGLLIDSQSGLLTELPPGTALGFSADGVQLFYQLNTGPGVFALISTADGSGQTFLFSGDLVGFPLGFRWSGSTPQLVAVQSTGTAASRPISHVLEINVRNGVTHELAQFDSDTRCCTASWSEDGQTLAIWLAPSPLRSELALIREGAAPAIVLRVDGDVGPAVFSPSGTAVVYPVYVSSGTLFSTRSLYVKTGI